MRLNCLDLVSIILFYYTKAKNNGLENSVCTLYEIHSGEDSENEGKLFNAQVLCEIIYCTVV